MSEIKLPYDITLIVLPGGPGLTSESLSELKALSASVNVIAIDPPDHADDWSYEAQIAFIRSKLPTSGRLVLSGHSAGGIQAADLALRETRTAGLICLATPFSEASFASIGAEFTEHMSGDLEKSGKDFEQHPSDESFREWLSHYGYFYFRPTNARSGSAMLKQARTQYRAYLGAETELGQKSNLLPALRKANIPKLYLYGELDKLFLKEHAHEDGLAGGFETHEVLGASHFLTFDEPQKTTDLILEFLSTNFGSNQQPETKGNQ